MHNHLSNNSPNKHSQSRSDLEVASEDNRLGDKEEDRRGQEDSQLPLQ